MEQTVDEFGCAYIHLESLEEQDWHLPSNAGNLLIIPTPS